MQSGKVVIIGSGFVGTSIAYAALIRGLISELVLIDINKDKAEGEAMDLSHGLPFIRSAEIRAGDFNDCEGAEVIIITAGANQKPGQTRLDLAQQNVSILHSILEKILLYEREAILLIVSNPVDVLTTVASKYPEFKPGKVIGSGTVLDTARFRYILSLHCKVNPASIHAYVIGEHGDSEVPLFSSASVAGTQLETLCQDCGGMCNPDWHTQVTREVKEAAYKIISRKGATYYGIGLACAHILRSILRDEQTVLTVSTMLNDLYGHYGIALSMPCVIGREGIVRRLPIQMNDQEKLLLEKSIITLRESVSQLNP